MTPTNDVLSELAQQIEDTVIELEELQECGDLEDVLECSLRLDDLKAQRLRVSLLETGSL